LTTSGSSYGNPATLSWGSGATGLAVSGSPSDYQIPMRLSSANSWQEFPHVRSIGATGETLVVYDGTPSSGGYISSTRSTGNYGSGASGYAGHFFVKKLSGHGPLVVSTESQGNNETQYLQMKMTGGSGEDGYFLKWNHSGSTAEWAQVSSSGGGAVISDSETVGTKTWSSNKINTELGNKLDSNKVYSSQRTATDEVYSASYINGLTVASMNTDTEKSYNTVYVNAISTALNNKFDVGNLRTTYGTGAGEAYNVPYINTTVGGKLDSNKVYASYRTAADEVYSASYVNGLTVSSTSTDAEKSYNTAYINALNTSLTTSLSNKIDTASIKTSTSTGVGDIYNAPFINAELDDKIPVGRLRTTYGTAANELYNVDYLNSKIQGLTYTASGQYTDVDGVLTVKKNTDPIVAIQSDENSTGQRVGALIFRAKNSSNGYKDYSFLEQTITSNTASSEYATLDLFTIVGGSGTKVAEFGKASSSDSAVKFPHGDVTVTNNLTATSVTYGSNGAQSRAVTAPTSSGQVLTATGAGTWAWASASSGLPAQTGSGIHTHVLRTNGTVAAWEPLKVQGETWSASSTRNANGDLTTIYGDQTIFADSGYDAYIHMVSPKNNANVGRIDCYAHNSASATTVFSAIETNIHSNTSTATYGSMTLYASQAGSNTEDLTAVMRVGKTSASDSVAQINGELRLTAPLKFNDSTTQASAVPAPATSGHVLTAGAGGSWAWAAAAGGSPTYTTTALPSYTSNAQGPTNTGLNGVGTGDRRYKWTMYSDDQWTHVHGTYPETQQPLSLLINGNRNDQTSNSQAAVCGSSWYYRNNENKRYPFSKVSFLAYGGGFGYDDRFCVGASNDGNEWTWFKCFSMGAGSLSASPFTCPLGTGNSTGVTNFDGTTISQNSGYYYTPTAVSGITNGHAANTAIFTNTTGYLIYRIMWIAGGAAQTTTDNVEYYRMSIAEVEWG